MTFPKILTVLVLIISLCALDPALGQTRRRSTHRPTKQPAASSPGSTSPSDTPKSENSKKLSPEKIDSAKAALKALRKIAGATEVGVTFAKYGELLIDAKAEVDEATSALPDGELKGEISLAMEAYVDAGRAWEDAGSYNMILLRMDGKPAEPGSSLREKYSIPTQIMGGEEILNGDTARSTIWNAAKKHIDRATELLNQ